MIEDNLNKEEPFFPLLALLGNSCVIKNETSLYKVRSVFEKHKPIQGSTLVVESEVRFHLEIFEPYL